MKILFFVIHLLVFSTGGKAQETTTAQETTPAQESTTPYPCYDPSDDACSMADYDVLNIKCTGEGYDTCTCEAEADAGETCTEVTNALVGQGTMTADSCRDLCVTQAAGDSEKKCYFYRWEQHPNPEDGNFDCTMRSFNIEVPCRAEPCIDEQACVSGHIDCDGGGIIHPVSPFPPVPCPGQITYYSSKVHWRCIRHGPVGPQRSSLNPYMDETLPPDTICFTMKKCNAWDENEGSDNTYEYELVAKCDGSIRDDNDAGTWVADTDLTGDVDVTNKFIEGNTLIEPDLEEDCASTCEDLELYEELLDIPGIEVFCTYPLEDWTIKPPNACILLCDQELQTTASCVYNPEDGSKNWKDDKEVPEDVTAESFLCSWMEAPTTTEEPTEAPTADPTDADL